MPGERHRPPGGGPAPGTGAAADEAAAGLRSGRRKHGPGHARGVCTTHYDKEPTGHGAAIGTVPMTTP